MGPLSQVVAYDEKNDPDRPTAVHAVNPPVTFDDGKNWFWGNRVVGLLVDVSAKGNELRERVAFELIPYRDVILDD